VPRYQFVCPDGHVIEQREGIDVELIHCACGKPARRRQVYREQGVIFKGGGFTKTVVPPAPPSPPSSAGESTDVHFERLDEFADKQYDHDKNVRPYVKEAKGHEHNNSGS